MSTGTGGTPGTPAPPPGWYPDAYGLRWWDGVAWGPVATVPYGGPTGPPQTEEESGRTIAILAQLWPVAALVLSCFAFVLPLILYLVQKDDNRFARWHAGEALNSALTFTLIGVVPVFIGWFSFIATTFDRPYDDDPAPPVLFLVGMGVALVAGLIALGLGILGAVRASQGVWWKNPLAIPFVRAHRRIARRPLA